MKSIQPINNATLNGLSAEAAAAPRLRKNLNFHKSDDDACHRLLNAMEPGTYIQPHRHLGKGKDETVAILRGKLGLIEFDESGDVVGTMILEPTGENVGVHIPRGVIHAWVSLEKNSIFLEAKAGPYIPIKPEEKVSWAPPEGDPEANNYLARLLKLFEITDESIGSLQQ